MHGRFGSRVGKSDQIDARHLFDLLSGFDFVFMGHGKSVSDPILGCLLLPSFFL
jgi:hypothetical protein